MLKRARYVMLAIALAAGLLSIPAAQAQDEQAADAQAFLEAWLASPHGDATAPAFTHWDDEGEIPGTCATCHSGIGFRDFIGADGTAASMIDNPVPVGSVIDCETCHNDVSTVMSEVTFPSGVAISGIERGASCMVCHQGTQSTASVNTTLGARPEDIADPELAFINVHYRAAAATMMGTEVKGAFEYEGKTYIGKFEHVPPVSTCIDCHDPHSLKIDLQTCQGCHEVQELRAIRTSLQDFDGNQDTAEGIFAEIERQTDRLYLAIQTYAREVSGTPVIYAHAYPYFFADTDGDGMAGDGEAIFPNRYQSWSPRLLRAAYNYQFIIQDPGAYTHNPHYALQILYDSIENLALRAPIEMQGMVRP